VRRVTDDFPRVGTVLRGSGECIGGIGAGVIAAKMRADAQHIAIATVGRVDVLVNWNFKHIVNLRRIHGYNSVNLREGYPLIEIRTPREVLSDE
jgi:hypothetical protein